jgi:hypothetical protein
LLLVLIIISALTALFLLLMRFIQPELIYSVRQGMVSVGTNKAFIDKMDGRHDVDVMYKQLLVQEDRHETRTSDEMFILLNRVAKISELYRLLDPRRPLVKDQKPQVCIVELGALLSNLGHNVEINPEHIAPTIKAGAVLKYIANEILASQNEKPLENDDDIDDWFTDNPISIPQVIELLIAAVVALAHRQQAARADGMDVKAPDAIDARARIKRFEKRLRLFVRGCLQEKYKSEDAISKRVQESLGESAYRESLKQMEKTRKQSPGTALDFFEFISSEQLKTLILNDWEPSFCIVFEDQAWIAKRLELIAKVRAHNWLIGDDDKKTAINYCGEIRARIQKLKEATR